MDENGPNESGEQQPQQSETPHQEHHQEAPKKKNWLPKALGGLALFVLFVAFKISLKFGVGYGLGEAEIAASKSQAWDIEYKASFNEGCVSAVQSEVPDVDPRYIQAYCSCYTDGIEGAHIIPTKYNTITSTEDQYAEEVGKVLDGYLESQDGQNLINGCVKTAQTILTQPTDNKRMPASL